MCNINNKTKIIIVLTIVIKQNYITLHYIT